MGTTTAELIEIMHSKGHSVLPFEPLPTWYLSIRVDGVDMTESAFRSHAWTLIRHDETRLGRMCAHA